jgi:hypothetical protein
MTAINFWKDDSVDCAGLQEHWMILKIINTTWNYVEDMATKRGGD